MVKELKIGIWYKTVIICLSYYLLKVGKIEIGKYKLNNWYYYNQKLKNWQMILKIVESTFKSIIIWMSLFIDSWYKNRNNKCWNPI